MLHIIASGGLYGAERMLLALAAECQAIGHEVIVCSLLTHETEEDSLGNAAKALGLETKTVVVGRGIALRQFKSLLDRSISGPVDVVHAHGYKAIILLGLVARRWRPFPIVCTLHGWTATIAFSKLAIYEWLARVVLFRFDCVVAVSTALATSVPFWVSGERVKMIPNGIDPNAGLESKRSFQLQPRRGSSASRLLAVGRLSREKGFDILLEAVALLVRDGLALELAIAGEGPERQGLQEHVLRLGIGEQVRFLGYVEDIWPILSGANVLVIPSRQEGLPIILLEAMSCGTPVVASRVGQIGAVLQDGGLGGLVTPGSADALARAIRTTLDDQLGANQRAARARDVVAEFYSARSMAQGYCDIYQQCVGQR